MSARGPLKSSHSARAARRVWRKFWWRALIFLGVFSAALMAFEAGVNVTEHPELQGHGLLTKVYFSVSLFVLGGTDLGTPVGGPEWARGVLWFVYFAAPAVTASALIEGLVLLVNPHAWALRRLSGHVVIAGAGELAGVYLKRLREAGYRQPVLLIEHNANHPSLEVLSEAYGARPIIGNIADDTLLRMLKLERAAHVLLLTGDDFVNLDTATKILQAEPALASSIVVHVGDLGFMRAVANTRVGRECQIFNTHQLAAAHLARTEILRHFEQTDHPDVMVLAGFGRFGQTVLAEVQNTMASELERVIIVDLEAERRALEFAHHVGFISGYERVVVKGDLREPDVWETLEQSVGRAPLFVVGSNDDGANLRTGLWVLTRFSDARVIARSFGRSAFAEEVAREHGFVTFGVADLVAASIPDSWLSPGRGRA